MRYRLKKEATFFGGLAHPAGAIAIEATDEEREAFVTECDQGARIATMRDCVDAGECKVVLVDGHWYAEMVSNLDPAE